MDEKITTSHHTMHTNWMLEVPPASCLVLQFVFHVHGANLLYSKDRNESQPKAMSQRTKFSLLECICTTTTGKIIKFTPLLLMVWKLTSSLRVKCFSVILLNRLVRIWDDIKKHLCQWMPVTSLLSWLFNDHTVSDERMIDEPWIQRDLEWNWFGLIEIPFPNLMAVTEEHHKNSQSEYPMSLLRFELSTSRIKV